MCPAIQRIATCIYTQLWLMDILDDAILDYAENVAAEQHEHAHHHSLIKQHYTVDDLCISRQYNILPDCPWRVSPDQRLIGLRGCTGS